MARLTELEDVLFPVDVHPIFVNVGNSTGERQTPVPGKKAIVDAASGRVLGVVGQAYRLVSNQQALSWALECCRTVFPETSSSEWEVKAVDAPSTGGHCCMDLVHNSTILDFSLVSPSGRPDVFGPFIRVTNSYNGLRALAFDIGFFRKVCANGLIIKDAIITFKFTHLRRDIGETIKFEIAHDRLTNFKSSFADYIRVLRSCPVPKRDLAPFLQGVLSLQSPGIFKPHTREGQDWFALNAHTEALCDRYSAELGDNAYAVFNAVTEFASHPPANRFVRRDRDSLQRLAGEWVSDFSQRCRHSAFDLAGYLSTLTMSKGAVTDTRHTWQMH